MTDDSLRLIGLYIGDISGSDELVSVPQVEVSSVNSIVSKVVSDTLAQLGISEKSSTVTYHDVRGAAELAARQTVEYFITKRADNQEQE